MYKCQSLSIWWVIDFAFSANLCFTKSQSNMFLINENQFKGSWVRNDLTRTLKHKIIMIYSMCNWKVFLNKNYYTSTVTATKINFHWQTVLQYVAYTAVYMLNKNGNNFLINVAACLGFFSQILSDSVFQCRCYGLR